MNYQISKNNNVCIGPCYPPGFKFIHPLTMNAIENKKENKSICPINPYENTDDNGKKEMIFFDECVDDGDNMNDANLQKDIVYNLLNPDMLFDHKLFLLKFYNLTSYENILEWLKINEHLPISTKYRIIECMFVVFWKQILIIDTTIINIHIELFTEHISHFYKKICKYIDVSNNKLIIAHTELDNNEFLVERINFLKDKLINETEVSKFIVKYFENCKKNEEHNKKIFIEKFQKMKLIDNFLLYIENKLKLSITNI